MMWTVALAVGTSAQTTVPWPPLIVSVSPLG
jgi:hypothetical protein